MPTLRQLQRTQSNVTLRWFERGRVWDSPEAAKEANFARQRENAARKDGWRPGGSHKDPRARYQLTRDQKRSRFKERLIRFGPSQDRDDHAPGAPPKPEGPPRTETAPPRTESAPPRPEGATPRADRPPHAQWRKPWQKPQGDRTFRPRENSGSGADRRPDWRSKERPGSTDRPKFDRPKFDRPKFDRPKERYGSSDRPKFDRPKERYGSNDRPKFTGQRNATVRLTGPSSTAQSLTAPSSMGRKAIGRGASPRVRVAGATNAALPTAKAGLIIAVTNARGARTRRPPGGSGARPPWNRGPGGSRPAWKGKPRPEGARFKSRPPGRYGPPKPRGPKKPR